RFLLLDPEHATIPTLLGMVRSFVFRHGIRGLVIDPWNRLDHTRAPGVMLTEHVRDHLGMLSAFAKRKDIHICLMAHPKKTESDAASKPPTAYDISDSAHFFNMADNILVVHRDKGDDNAPVQILTQKIRRQRVGMLGTALLRFDRLTGRYYDR
ncbi:MAG: topoisomerase, partial [Thermomicrobiales bacterium]|nr:topoisomerase [Thermomicrobiales bacterium]